MLKKLLEESLIKPDWCSWMRLIEHKPASINVDCNAHNPETEKLHTFIAVITHDLGMSRNGFPTSDKFDEIYAFEEKLEKTVHRNKGKYAGRFITNGEGFYLMYTNDSDLLKQKVEDLVKHYTFPFEFSEREDREWKLYFEMIYPPAKQKQRYNTSVLIRNIAMTNDDLEEEHIIDHAIFFSTKDDVKKYMDALRKVKFPIEKYQEFANEDETYTLEVSVKSPIKADLLDSSTDILIDLAEKCNGFYDGWGTELTR